MKSSRGLSFLLLTVVYLVATAVGVVVYLWLGDMPTWAKLLIADIAATVATFLCSVVFKNASVYDPYWSVAPIVIVYAFLWNTEITAAKLLMVIAVTLWGGALDGKLGVYLSRAYISRLAIHDASRKDGCAVSIRQLFRYSSRTYPSRLRLRIARSVSFRGQSFPQRRDGNFLRFCACGGYLARGGGLPNA